MIIPPWNNHGQKKKIIIFKSQPYFVINHVPYIFNHEKELSETPVLQNGGNRWRILTKNKSEFDMAKAWVTQQR